MYEIKIDAFEDFSEDKMFDFSYYSSKPSLFCYQTVYIQKSIFKKQEHWLRTYGHKKIL